MAQPHREYILEVFADQTFVKDIVKGACDSIRPSQRTTEYHADQYNLLGVLHTIFFHRYFPSIRPSLYTPSAASSHSHSAQSLPIPLPAILDPPEISAAIDLHTAALVSQLTSPSPANVPPGGSRGEIVVQFYDRKRRKMGYTGGWLGRLGGGGQTEEEVCWEEWTLQVVVARPRSEAGTLRSGVRSVVNALTCDQS
jgi:autophagy-related protein 101